MNNNNNNILFNNIFDTMGYNSYEKKIILSNFDDLSINNYANNLIDNISSSDTSIFYTDISDAIKDIHDHSSRIISFHQNEKEYNIKKNGIGGYKENISRQSLDLPNFVNDNHKKNISNNKKKMSKSPKNNGKKFKSNSGTSKLIRRIAITSRTYSFSFWCKSYD